MKFVFFFFSIILILACGSSNKDDHQLFLFNDISFKLNDGEEIAVIDSFEREMYDSYFDKRAVQIPLFRCIKARDYTLFIGIPFHTSVKELAKNSLTQDLNQTNFLGDSVNYFFKTYNDRHEYLAVYTRRFDDNLVYVLATTGSAPLSDSLFRLDKIANRFSR